MQEDRRLFEREPVIVEIEPIGQLPGKKYRLRDISKSGFKLETDQCMSEGERFDFSFSLPDGKASYRLCGKVIRVNKISSTPESYYIGFAFQTPLDKLPPELFSLPLTNPEETILVG
jgi:PilZ domain